MSEDNAHENQLTGDEAKAFAAQMLGGAHVLGSVGEGGQTRVAAVEECFAHADTPVDLANRPLLQTVADSKPSGKTPGPSGPQMKIKPPEPK